MGTPQQKHQEEKGHWGAWYLLVIGALLLFIAGFYLLKNHFA